MDLAPSQIIDLYADLYDAYAGRHRGSGHICELYCERYITKPWMCPDHGDSQAAWRTRFGRNLFAMFCLFVAKHRDAEILVSQDRTDTDWQPWDKWLLEGVSTYRIWVKVCPKPTITDADKA